MEGIDLIEFEMPSEESSIIKVIGVGGGGGNAVNHMFREGIKDVTFIVCNTDKQALDNSPIQKKIQLGPGLGAGNQPLVARDFAESAADEIRLALSNNTKMVFITAGMGGGTGTGAAPVIAKIARELDILTVGIVTIPFAFEGPRKIAQALEGVRLINENVDALLVINNERLCDIYPDFNLANAFSKADDVLKDAAKGIAEIITIHGHINVDFADVNTIMRNGGVAIMNTGYASGEKRLRKAIDNAIASPLLKNNSVVGAKKILMNFYCREDETSIKIDEIAQINEFMELVGDQAEVIWGISFDNDLEEEVKITLIATGFEVNDVVPQAKTPIHLDQTPQPEANQTTTKTVVTSAVNEEAILSVSEDVINPSENEDTDVELTFSAEEDEIAVLNEHTQLNFEDEELEAVENKTDLFDSESLNPEPETFAQNNQPAFVETPKNQSEIDPLFDKYYGDTKIEQKKKAENFASMTQQIDDDQVVEELEKTPAYKRRTSSDGPKPFSFS